MRAIVAVIAAHGVVRVRAGAVTVTRVIGAQITVIAYVGGSNAAPPCAGIGVGAIIAVIATDGVVGEGAGSVSVAGVIRAKLAIITGIGSTVTRAIRAHIRVRAVVTIVACHAAVVLKHTGDAIT